MKKKSHLSNYDEKNLFTVMGRRERGISNPGIANSQKKNASVLPEERERDISRPEKKQGGIPSKKKKRGRKTLPVKGANRIDRGGIKSLLDSPSLYTFEKGGNGRVFSGRTL